MTRTHATRRSTRTRLVAAVVAGLIAVTTVAVTPDEAEAAPSIAVACNARNNAIGTYHSAGSWSYTIVYRWTARGWQPVARSSGWEAGRSTAFTGLQDGFYAVVAYTWTSTAGTTRLTPRYTTSAPDYRDYTSSYYCMV